MPYDGSAAAAGLAPSAAVRHSAAAAAATATVRVCQRPAGRGFPRVAHLPPPLPLPSHVGSSVREGRTGDREELRHIGVLRGQAATSLRAAAAIDSASIPAAAQLLSRRRRARHGAAPPAAPARHRAAVRTNAVRHGVAEPALRPVVLHGDADSRSLGRLPCSVSTSTGLTEYRSITRTGMPSAASMSAAAQRLVHRHAGRHDGDPVLGRVPRSTLAAADRELLVRRVDRPGFRRAWCADS